MDFDQTESLGESGTLLIFKVKFLGEGIRNALHCPCLVFNKVYLRNKSWKPEYVLSFNMGWWILVFYFEQ